jgi:hypothetical protein
MIEPNTKPKLEFWNFKLFVLKQRTLGALKGTSTKKIRVKGPFEIHTGYRSTIKTVYIRTESRINEIFLVMNQL